MKEGVPKANGYVLSSLWMRRGCVPWFVMGRRFETFSRGRGNFYGLFAWIKDLFRNFAGDIDGPGQEIGLFETVKSNERIT